MEIVFTNKKKFIKKMSSKTTHQSKKSTLKKIFTKKLRFDEL